MRITAPDLSFQDVLRGLAERGQPIGVAVSGGSDSMALLHRLHLYEAPPLQVMAVTVDHGLREGAAAEAAKVGVYCKARDIPHQILTWEGWDRQGNLQDQARRARYRLLSGWAQERGVSHVALGHTADDNIETFVQGLIRGAGLNGLTGMRPMFQREGVRFIRPLLRERRRDLQKWLTAEGVGWSDDPSNEDVGFDRVRIRQIMRDLPVEADTLSKVIDNLRDTRDGLERDMARWVQQHVSQRFGDLEFDAAAFAALSRDMRRRVLNAALRWVSSADYPPRAEKVMRLLPEPPNSPFSVHGCIVGVEGERWRIGREPQAVALETAAVGAVWDGRWRVHGPGVDGTEVRALGETGLLQCPDWRDSGTARVALMASPAVWRGDQLVAAPLLGNSDGWAAHIVTDFHEWLVSH